jgi:hypothetical protein
MVKEKLILNDVEGSVHFQLKVLPRNLPSGTKENHE